MKILLTGGLGYIGSHISYLLGEKAVIIDNKINSNLNYKKYLPKAKVYVKDLNSRNLSKIFLENKIEGVIHLAGLKSVSESVIDPLKYYKNNFLPTLDLLNSMKQFKIKKLIFSSSATVYGINNISPLGENISLSAHNPYGNTKIVIENLIRDFCNSYKNFKCISLRYFNPIGSEVTANLQDQPLGKPQNLMPIILNAAKHNITFYINGNDYKTKDGTCIRDYIHVKDLANAHLKALNKIKKIQNFLPINIGLGKGKSVLEIIKIFQKVNKVKLKYKVTKRREGDIAEIYADNSLALKFLNWKPKFSYEDMVKDAWRGYSND